MYSDRRHTPKRPKKPTITQNRRYKHFRSELYNYAFDLRSGHFRRWGKGGTGNPPWSMYGPEVLNVEISSGAGCSMTCAACYKKNNKGGNIPKNMSLETFKAIFDTLPCVVGKNSGNKIYFVTQINFEITSINSHPQMWDIFDYCRENGVIPNVTINGADVLDKMTMMRLVDTCGIINVTVGLTNFTNACNQIQAMTKYGAGRVNIHYLLSNQSLDFLYDTLLPFVKEGPQLVGIHEIVFLGLKPIGRGQNFDVCPSGEYIRLLNYCVKKNIRFSNDTCSATFFEAAIDFLQLTPLQKQTLKKKQNRCEAGLYAGYIDVSGRYWFCSFGEGLDEAGGYVDVSKVQDFHKEVWMAEPIKKWRSKVIHNGRECSLFDELTTEGKKVYNVT